MKFIATRFEPDGEYSETFDAPSWIAAEHVCERNGWRLDGSDVIELPAGTTMDQAQELTDAMNDKNGETLQ